MENDQIYIASGIVIADRGRFGPVVRKTLVIAI